MNGVWAFGLHAPALVALLGVVDGRVSVEISLHLFDSFVPLLATLDTEVLAQEPAMQALGEPV